jgi:hypothetical protein
MSSTKLDVAMFTSIFSFANKNRVYIKKRIDEIDDLCDIFVRTRLFSCFFHQTLIRLIDYSWILLLIWEFELINEVFSWHLTIAWLRRSRKRLWRLERHKLCSSSSSMIIQCHVSNSWLHRLLIILFVRSSDLDQVDQMSVQNKIIVMQLFSQKFFLNSLITYYSISFRNDVIRFIRFFQNCFDFFSSAYEMMFSRDELEIKQKKDVWNWIICFLNNQES